MSQTGGPSDPTQWIDTVDSAEPPSGRRPRWRTAATALVAVLALLAAGALGAALASGTGSGPSLAAASGNDSTDDSTDDGSADSDDPWERMDKLREWAEENGPGMMRGRGHPFLHGFGHGLLGAGLFGGALHGTYVVPDPDGGYQTVVVQRGEVTDVSDTSLTVVSDDDFTTTYRVDDDTLVMGGAGGVEGIDEGDRVHVTGVRSGDTVRAVHVTDLSAFDRERSQQDGGSGSSTGTGSGTSST